MPLGVQCTFVCQQYRYQWSSLTIEAKSGETVIDFGGCWGDRAIYFANAVYHSLGEYYTIQQWLDQIGLGYRLTLDRFTIDG